MAVRDSTPRWFPEAAISGWSEEERNRRIVDERVNGQVKEYAAHPKNAVVKYHAINGDGWGEIVAMNIDGEIDGDGPFGGTFSNDIKANDLKNGSWQMICASKSSYVEQHLQNSKWQPFLEAPDFKPEQFVKLVELCQQIRMVEAEDAGLFGRIRDVLTRLEALARIDVDCPRKWPSFSQVCMSPDCQQVRLLLQRPQTSEPPCPFGVSVPRWNQLYLELEEVREDIPITAKEYTNTVDDVLGILRGIDPERTVKAVDPEDTYFKSFENVFGPQAKAELAAILLDLEKNNPR